MTEPFGEHTCACGQPADRHRFVGGWMCGACAEKQDHPWMQENPMTPPDRPAPQPAPDLDALLVRLRQRGYEYGEDGQAVAGPDHDALDAADAITTLRAQLAELQANQIPTPLPGMHYEQVPDGETLSEITAEWGKTIRAMMVNKAEAVIAKKRVAELEIERAKWRENWRDELRARRVAESRVAALEAALMAIRGKASELVEFYASGVSKEIANLADAALKGGAAT